MALATTPVRRATSSATSVADSASAVTLSLSTSLAALVLTTPVSGSGGGGGGVKTTPRTPSLMLGYAVAPDRAGASSAATADPLTRWAVFYTLPAAVAVAAATCLAP